jgi:hypothetical protein
MNVEIGNEAAQFHLLGLFVLNFRYSVGDKKERQFRSKLMIKNSLFISIFRTVHHISKLLVYRQSNCADSSQIINLLRLLVPK